MSSSYSLAGTDRQTDIHAICDGCSTRFPGESWIRTEGLEEIVDCWAAQQSLQWLHHSQGNNRDLVLELPGNTASLGMRPGNTACERGLGMKPAGE